MHRPLPSLSLVAEPVTNLIKWIAPPQGSIIPLWHRGAAPNYQPKPLIAKNHYDPVTVWKRRGAVSAVAKDGESSETS
jgi:hypothetical protein